MINVRINIRISVSIWANLSIAILLVLSEVHSDQVEKNKLPDFVDYEAYDAEVFKCAQTKPRPQTLMPGYNPYTRNRENRHPGELDGVDKFLKDEKLVSFDNVMRKSNSFAMSGKRNKVSLLF